MMSGLPRDKVKLIKSNDKDLMVFSKTLDEVREDITKFHGMGITDDDIKKFYSN